MLLDKSFYLEPDKVQYIENPDVYHKYEVIRDLRSD